MPATPFTPYIYIALPRVSRFLVVRVVLYPGFSMLAIYGVTHK